MLPRSPASGIIDSVLRLFPDQLRRYLDPGSPGVAPEPIGPILDLRDDARFELDVR